MRGLYLKILAVCIGLFTLFGLGIEALVWFGNVDDDIAVIEGAMWGGTQLAVERFEAGASTDELTRTFGYPVVPVTRGDVPEELAPYLSEYGVAFDGWSMLYAETSTEQIVLQFGPLPEYGWPWWQRLALLTLAVAVLAVGLRLLLGPLEREHAELRSLDDARVHLFRSASHELKTPLSRLRFGIELLAEAETQTERRERAAALDEDLGQLSGLVDELLEYARAEVVTPEELDAASLIEVEPGPIRIDARAFRRVLDNLGRNAEAHASTVEVSARWTAEALEVCVDDDGPGIAPDRREAMLRPFEGKGHGLGLSICAQILAAHRGRLVLEDSPLGGLRVRTIWPRHTS